MPDLQGLSVEEIALLESLPIEGKLADLDDPKWERFWKQGYVYFNHPNGQITLDELGDTLLSTLREERERAGVKLEEATELLRCVVMDTVDGYPGCDKMPGECSCSVNRAWNWLGANLPPDTNLPEFHPAANPSSPDLSVLGEKDKGNGSRSAPEASEELPSTEDPRVAEKES